MTTAINTATRRTATTTAAFVNDLSLYDLVACPFGVGVADVIIAAADYDVVFVYVITSLFVCIACDCVVITCDIDIVSADVVITFDDFVVGVGVVGTEMSQWSTGENKGNK